MRPQHLATPTSSVARFDAPVPHCKLSISLSYLSKAPSRSFPQGYTQVTDPQNAGENRMLSGFVRVDNRDRRQTCRRASRALWPSHCWPSWPHVAPTTQVTLKNSWSWTRFQLRLSRPSPASTTKSCRKTPGQASAPVLSPQRARQTSRARM